ncbi:uncharacterized protein LOC120002194 isoform X2 [Tripterygium wilfordii]|uniref:uncharacterized protein LOC120002194 isoform X2 n=1 Tax=Tripterygium wilfordii TaxID=458696 RepID=UPI0018F7EF6E|nr:uncharacterized protein LOC120002194 isoform X2 [Tripterygium wilfordii]
MIGSRRYSYSQEKRNAIGVHHVQVGRRSDVGAGLGLLVRLSPLLLLLLPYALNLFLLKDKSLSILLWSCLFSSFIVILLIRKPVKKAFGVQLETHYLSGKVFRHFIPIEKILKPVLLECLTPTTCYWSLALMMRGEEELMLLFKELRPPLKILVPIWKALKNVPTLFTEDGQQC